MKSLFLKSSLTFTLLAVAVCGCGGGGSDRPKLVPVTGTVVYNGTPVAGATVSFWAEKAPRPAEGVTDSQGKFSLSMFDFNDGAIPGANKITVTKVAAAAANNTANMTEMLNDPAKRAQMMQQTTTQKTEEAKPEVPAKYGNRESTPLSETVADPGPNQFVLQLAD